MIYKTRRVKLSEKIKFELNKSNPDINTILHYVDEYEKNNLDTINKLKRKKNLSLRKINGALRQTIHAHGPITMMLIGSASKRIYGNLLAEKTSIMQKILKWIKN